MHCRRQHVQENVKAPFNDHDFKLKYRIKRLVDKNWVQHKPHSIPFCLLGIIFCIQIKYEVSLKSSKKSAKVMFIHSFQRQEQQKLVFTFEWSKIFLGAALGPPPLLKTFSKCIITHWNAGKINANSAFNPINVDLFYYPKLFHTAIFLQQVSSDYLYTCFCQSRTTKGLVKKCNWKYSIDVWCLI